MNNSQQTKEWAGVGKLDQLVRELERQKESRIDACIDTRQVIVSTANREEHGLHCVQSKELNLLSFCVQLREHRSVLKR